MARGARTLMSDEVVSIRYRHQHNGKYYQHDFGPGVKMWAEKDGSIRLSKSGVDLFEEYPDEE